MPPTVQRQSYWYIVPLLPYRLCRSHRVAPARAIYRMALTETR